MCYLGNDIIMCYFLWIFDNVFKIRHIITSPTPQFPGEHLKEIPEKLSKVGCLFPWLFTSGVIKKTLSLDQESGLQASGYLQTSSLSLQVSATIPQPQGLSVVLGDSQFSVFRLSGPHFKIISSISVLK